MSANRVIWIAVVVLGVVIMAVLAVGALQQPQATPVQLRDARGSLVGTAVLTQRPIPVVGGTALVIHADRDDQMTDPSGKSGTRVACGVIAPG
jgi:hypothetical protein